MGDGARKGSRSRPSLSFDFWLTSMRAIPSSSSIEPCRVSGYSRIPRTYVRTYRVPSSITVNSFCETERGVEKKYQTEVGSPPICALQMRGTSMLDSHQDEAVERGTISMGKGVKESWEYFVRGAGAAARK